MEMEKSMEMIKICLLGLSGMFISILFKNGKQEYSIYICLITGVIIFSFAIDTVVEIKSVIENLGNYFNVGNQYIATLFKMSGITYLAEFASNICKDAGYGAIAGQIEMFGKLSLLLLSLPVMLALLDTVSTFLG